MYRYTNGPTNPGNRQNVGYLIGQQYNLNTDATLTDRAGRPLVFTRQVKLIETDVNTLEVTGIRPMKYPPDFVNNGAGAIDNDLVHLRLPDILLMKAEAIMRGGNAATAGTFGSTPLALVNAIRANRGASTLTTLTLETLHDERGRELYLEMWRRQDMIRFGKFLGTIQEGPTSSAPTYLIFPIPNQQLAANTNLSQNTEY